MFRVGDRVVYIGNDITFDSSGGKNIHIIQAIKQGCCQLWFDVGIREYKPHQMYCEKCKHKESTPIIWKQQSSWRKVYPAYTESEIESVNIDDLVEPEYCELKK